MCYHSQYLPYIQLFSIIQFHVLFVLVHPYSYPAVCAKVEPCFYCYTKFCFMFVLCLLQLLMLLSVWIIERISGLQFWSLFHEIRIKIYKSVHLFSAHIHRHCKLIESMENLYQLCIISIYFHSSDLSSQSLTTEPFFTHLYRCILADN